MHSQIIIDSLVMITFQLMYLLPKANVVKIYESMSF